MASPADERPAVHLAYITANFPDLTESFVRREIEQVRAQGVRATVFSLRPKPVHLADATLQKHIAETVYGPWLASGPLLAAHLYFLLRHPGRYLATLADVVRMAARQWRFPDMPVKTLAVFPKTVYFARVMQQRDVTQVHAHFANHPTTAAMLVARLLDIPFTFTGHAWDLFVKKNQVLLPEKLAAAGAVVTCTQFNRTFLEPFCAPGVAGRIAVRYHGVAIPERAPAARERDLIVAVGSLAPKKGFGVLLEACQRLAREGVDFRCEIVGEGPLRAELEEAIRTRGLDGRCSLLGARPNAEVIALMSRAAVFVMPSVRDKDDSMDGIPNVILEAFAVGTPVVATRISGIPEVVREGVTGRLVAPEDAAGLAAAIADVLRDHDRHLAQAEAGRRLVAEEFDLRRNAKAVLDWILADHALAR